MTVPPFTEDPEGARPYFRKLRELRDQIAARNFLASAWMCFPWACRTISKSRLKKDRPACGWGRRFLERTSITARRPETTEEF